MKFEATRYPNRKHTMMYEIKHGLKSGELKGSKSKALMNMKQGGKKIVEKGRTLAKKEAKDEVSSLREDTAYRR